MSALSAKTEICMTCRPSSGRLVANMGRSPSDVCREGERRFEFLARLREVVVRVRHLERLVREAAQEIAELVAEVGDDVVALRLDVGARAGLVLDRRAGRAGGVMDGPQNCGVFRYAGY